MSLEKKVSEGCSTTYVFPEMDRVTETGSQRTDLPQAEPGIANLESSQTRTFSGNDSSQLIVLEKSAISRNFPMSQKVPLHKTLSLDTAHSDSVGESERAGEDKPESADIQQSFKTRFDHGAGPSYPSSAGPARLPPKSALKKGHSRSASHGGVMSPRTGFSLMESIGSNAGTSASGPPLQSALKKGHTRAASHGQIVDDLTQGNLKGHSRAPSKTDFILPPEHTDRPRPLLPGSSQWERGHSRQASRSESVCTLRPTKVSFKSKFFFWRSPVSEDSRTRKIVPNHIVPPGTSHKDHPNGKYPSNHIRTTKYTAISFLPKNLFEQFHRFANIYFISIVLLNWFPQISAFGKEIAMLPVMFVLGVTAIKDLFEDRRRHYSDKRVNNSTCRVYNKELSRYTKVKWKEMRVGDLVHLSCNEMIPADILILRTSDSNGLCYIETMNLDGESNLKQRQVIRGYAEKQSTFQPSEFQSEIFVGAPTTKIYHFSGYVSNPDGTKIPITKENLLLRDSALKNTDFIEGIVVYAGRETKAMLNNGGPRHKRTGLEKMMNLEVMWCVVILAVMCIVGATGSSLWLSSFFDKTVPFAIHIVNEETGETPAPIWEGLLSFLTFIIILQVMIPLSLYVTIELTKLMQIFHIQNDIALYDPETDKPIECRAMNIPEDLGQVQYVFSDKTGTLTENKMMFRRCTIGAIDYNHAPPSAAEEAAFGKSSQNPPLKINTTLNDLLCHCESEPSRHLKENELTEQARRIHDFFMIMTVCNTVVVAKYPHHDKMNASGIIVESGDAVQGSRLSTIRETDSSLSSSYSQIERNTLIPELKISMENSPITGTSSQSSNNLPVQKIRRPGKLDIFPQTRPLSPISSSNETTPNESPAQLPRRLALGGLVGFRKALNLTGTQSNLTVSTPSPSELRPIFEAESPDELALVEAAYAYQCKLLKRTPKHVRVAITGEGLLEYEILHTFPFDSVRKRMSIILKHPTTDQVVLYCKGADSAIFNRLRKFVSRKEVDIMEATQAHVNSYAKEGLRTLVMAKRDLKEDEYKEWLVKYEIAETVNIENRDVAVLSCYNQLEQNLELVGATGIEDKLQDGVPETIENLRKAGIVVWVLTGDKQETAINIAYSCKLFSQTMDIIKLNARSKDSAERTIAFYTEQVSEMENFGATKKSETMENPFETGHRRIPSLDRPTLTSRDRALVVDGKTLTYILDQRNSKLLKPFLNLSRQCSAVLCCRATPLQKAFIVSSVKDHLGMKTLAIGDGQNDCSMIRAADIGVGISGKEGMAAVMASDFAISKFRYLERLLLVHGHWCYDRLARMILYFFYKNAAFVFVIFWFQLFNGWSGSVMIDQMYLMVFNLFFTALPPMAIGIYDQDASSEILVSFPKLYKQGRLQKVHKAHSFWWNMLDALYASIVIYFIAYGVYKDSDSGMPEFGTTVVVSCMYTMLVNMVIEAKSWTVLHVFSVIGSIAFFYIFAFIYNSLCGKFLGVDVPCKVIHMLVADPIHWLIIVLTVVVAVIPRLTYRVLKNSLWPNDVTKALITARYRKNMQDEEFAFFSNSSSRSSSSVFRENRVSLCFQRTKSNKSNVPTAVVPLPRNENC